MKFNKRKKNTVSFRVFGSLGRKSEDEEDSLGPEGNIDSITLFIVL